MKENIKIDKKTRDKMKKSLTLFRLIPNQFEIDLYLCLSELPVPEIIDFLDEELELHFERGYIERELDCPSTFFGLGDARAVIVLRSWDDLLNVAPILAHEMMHVVTYVSSIVATNINHEETSEVWAYFMSFYMTICLALIKEHNEQSKKNTTKKKVAKKKAKAKKTKKAVITEEKTEAEETPVKKGKKNK